MKLKINKWALIWRFMIFFLILGTAVFLASLTFLIDFSTGTWVPWETRQYVILAILIVLSIGGFIPSLNTTYEIGSKSFIMKKYGKESEYQYSNIEYIDEEKSRKKKMAIIYCKGSKFHQLISDKNNVLLDELLKKCKNVYSKEDFYTIHPEER